MSAIPERPIAATTSRRFMALQVTAGTGGDSPYRGSHKVQGDYSIHRSDTEVVAKSWGLRPTWGSVRHG